MIDLLSIFENILSWACILFEHALSQFHWTELIGLLQQFELLSHCFSLLFCHLLYYQFLWLVISLLLECFHCFLDLSSEYQSSLLTTSWGCYSCESGEFLVVCILLLQSKADNICNSRSTFTNSNFLVELVFRFFIKNNFDPTKISFLSFATTFCVIVNTFISFGFSNDTSMNP